MDAERKGILMIGCNSIQFRKLCTLCTLCTFGSLSLGTSMLGTRCENTHLGQDFLIPRAWNQSLRFRAGAQPSHFEIWRT